ncbi:alkaline phosphatase family protein [Thermococcus cleftensis]|uniref:alkaline phosphatase family protein n=1 Tax=Thermococcus cleftensis (strain DSM 27260 / KACC 17922 / CL1) TaxID=163003 RepID=UPI0011D1A6D4|nr:alkaline phosphatase family protein [Thermococcus cleftensis]
MGRIIILGIDGLEYDLVKEWNLKYLQQRAFTKTDLSDFEVIVTPPIWASMLTGKKIPEIEEPFIKRQKFIANKGNITKVKTPWYVKLGAKILPLSIRKKLGDAITSNPFEATYDYLLRNRKYRTIFDYFEKTWTNGVPSYGRNVSNPEVREAMKEAVKGNLRPLIEYAMRTYERDRRALMEALEKDYELIFWYTPFLDEVSHFLIGKKLKLMNLYFDLNKLAKLVSEKLDEGDVLYIISDHGMEPVPGDPRGGDHSDHGFFSSNTGELIGKPQELFDLVVKRAEGRK